jgi:hypothetical protein
MLLSENTNAASAAAGGGQTSSYAATQGVIEQFNDLKTAIDNFVLGDSMKVVLDNINKSMTEMNDSTLAMQRSMGGVAMGTDAFREKLYLAYQNTIELGSSFKDVVDAVGGLAEGMGRMVNPSQETLTNMVEISKATGLSTKDVGTLITEMTRFGVTQLEATSQIHDLSVEARKAGLSAKAYLTTIQSNMKSISGFGFKDGVEGMKNMVKQAMLLRTNIESIGAKSVQNSALDPEGAIQLAANFQMLGGTVGKLADPFQLMYMAQNDMEGLQNELVNSTKAAVTFNKATGEFSVSTEDMYRLRQQAELTGSNLEDLVKTGKEAAKMDYLKETFALDNFDEDTQSMIAGLAEVGKGGKVSIDIPGFRKLESDSAEGLKAQLQSTDAQKAIKDYQDKASKSEKDLAISQMTIQENQAKDVNIIKEAVLKSMPDRDKFLRTIENSNKKMGEAAISAANLAAPSTGLVAPEINKAIADAADAFTLGPEAIRRSESATETIRRQISSGVSISDAYFPAGGAPKIMSKGKIYEGIVGDEVAVGTNLGDALNKKMSGGKVEMGGKVDVNININGSVAGDSGNISNLFSDPKVQKQIMDTVLYKLDMYKKQQGVI